MGSSSPQHPQGCSSPVVSTRRPAGTSERPRPTQGVISTRPGPCPRTAALRPLGPTVSEPRRRRADIAEGAYAHLDGQPSAHQAVGHLLLADDSPARTSLCRVLREVGPRCILCPTETDGRNVPGEGGWTPGALGASGRYEAGTRRARVDFMHTVPQAPPCFRPHVRERTRRRSGPIRGRGRECRGDAGCGAGHHSSDCQE